MIDRENRSMRARARNGLAALAAVMSAVVTAPGASAQAPAPPATRPAGAPAANAPRRPTAAELKQPVATVNGEPITKGELIRFLSNYQIEPGTEQQAYQDSVESLANTHLVNQFLNRQRVQVPDEKVTQAIASLEKQLKADGTDLASEILRTGMSMDEVRSEYANRLRWFEFVNTRATDAELKKFAATHKDLFNGTQVKASHILAKVEPTASAAEKEKARQKLTDLKKTILAGKMTFAEAANKFSEDPANVDGAGGDVGYFTLNSGIIEDFAKAAFAMKKGEISDPVETPYGYHLIQVTDRKEGNPFDYEQNKPFVKQMYAAELMKTVLSAERKRAKIDVKPMPPDLFPPAPAQTPAPAPAPGQAPAPAAGTAKPAQPK
jgi:peptidyl-prolyl cis-trans isomerase C